MLLVHNHSVRRFMGRRSLGWALRQPLRGAVRLVAGRSRVGLTARHRKAVRHVCELCSGWCNCWSCDGSGGVYVGPDGGWGDCYDCGGRGGELVCDVCLASKGSSRWRANVRRKAPRVSGLTPVS